MLTRAEILMRHDLPDDDVFDMEPTLEVQNIWRVKVSRRGAGPLYMAVGSVARLAGEIRHIDPDLAEQCLAVVEDIKRRAENSN